MTEKMTVTFYRKELTWYGYEVEVEATSNEEAMEKIKDYDYKHINTTDEECDSVEGYGVFYFPDGTEVDERDYPLKESSNWPRDKFSYLQAQHTRRKGLNDCRDKPCMSHYPDFDHYCALKGQGCTYHVEDKPND